MSHHSGGECRIPSSLPLSAFVAPRGGSHMFVDDERPSSVNWRELDEADKPHELHVSLMDQVVVRANMRGVQTARYCEGGFSVSTPIL